MWILWLQYSSILERGVHLLSSINNLNVQGVNSIAMDTSHLSVVVQLQTKHPEDAERKSELSCATL